MILRGDPRSMDDRGRSDCRCPYLPLIRTMCEPSVVHGRGAGMHSARAQSGQNFTASASSHWLPAGFSRYWASQAQ